MTGLLHEKEFSRKSFVKGGGALIVGFSLLGSRLAGAARAADVPEGVADAPFASNGPYDETQVDTWLIVHADNTVSLLTGQAEIGQGTTTGMLQIIAEELNMELGQAKFVSPDTNVTPDTPAQTASNAIRSTGPLVRAAGAFAYQTLLGLAATNLGVPVGSLTVSGGVVSGGGKTVSYGDLLGGQLFNTTFSVTTANPGERGSSGLDPGQAPAKPVSQYTLVGTSVPRIDIPAKVTGTYTYIQNVRVPGMLHGRIVRPRGQSAYGNGTPIVSVDASSIAHIPGAQLVQKGDFLGVVAPQEYDAIQAAAQLKVSWGPAPQLSGDGNLFNQMYELDSAGEVITAQAVHNATDFNFNINPQNIGAALASASQVLSATYKYHYNAHVPIGPTCVVADVTPNGAVVYSNTQGTYGTRTKLATVLGIPQNQIRVVYFEGSSCYGESPYNDGAEAAALMSQLVGKPVRLQFMRWDEHGWDFYPPPQLTQITAGVNANGTIAGIDFTAFTIGSYATDLVVQQTTGIPAATPSLASVEHWGVIGSQYTIPSQNVVVKNLPVIDHYFRSSFMRAPLGPQTSFAYEQMIDELAYAAKMDPWQFRAANIATANNPLFPWYFTDRWLGVLNGAAQAAGWTPRVAASNLSDDTIVTGRGIAITPHAWTPTGTVAEIQVNKKTGKITVTNLYIAVDAGLSINPGAVENQMIGGGVQAISRTLVEQIAFNTSRVTSLDWVSYPILRFGDAPKVTAVVIQNTNQITGGVGEIPAVPVPPAIANAFFDATGVRLYEAPMTPSRVRGALQQAGVA